MGTRPLATRHAASGCAVRVVARPDSIDGEAIQQLDRTAERFGMRLAVGLPDLHPGRGHPIGAAFLTEYVLYPTLVGNDIGCGMALWRTGIPAHWRDFDRWTRRLAVLDEPVDPDDAVVTSAESESAGWRDQLGSIGGGNHFAELGQVDALFDVDAANALGLEEKKLTLLVHSGSRGLGESILRDHLRDHGDAGLQADSYEAKRYLRLHDEAVAWARDNRLNVAKRFLRALKAEGEPLLDLTHNAVLARNPERTRFLHRKGAAPADAGLVVIPGSRGTSTWIVRPTPLASGTDACGWSLAHGAGRRWKRADCKARLSHRTTEAELLRTRTGRVICGDRQLIWEEAPQAYKDVDAVVEDLVTHGLAERVARLVPVLSFKTAG